MSKESRYKEFLRECEDTANEFGMSLDTYLNIVRHIHSFKKPYEWSECNDFLAMFFIRSKKDD